MAFTSSDLTSVESAITDLSTGTRVVLVRFSSGKTIQYSESNLDDLIKLRALIKRDINLTAGNARHRYVATGKGY
ncbi:MAG: gpW family head-tail joining protein [Candidatus Thorarchaeota archaeon]